MATAAAIAALLKGRLRHGNADDEAVAVVMRQLDHLRLLITAIQMTMPEISDPRDFLYREIERKLIARNTNSWSKLEDFICAVVDAACRPESCLFDPDIGQAIREYYEGSFLATLSILFGIIDGSGSSDSWKSLSLQRDIMGVAQRTGYFQDSVRANSLPQPSNKTSVGMGSANARRSTSMSAASPQAPSGLSWFIPADDSDDDERFFSGRPAAYAVRDDALSRSSSIPATSADRQDGSITETSDDVETRRPAPGPKPRKSGGSRKSPELHHDLVPSAQTEVKSKTPRRHPSLFPNDQAEPPPRTDSIRSSKEIRDYVYSQVGRSHSPAPVETNQTVLLLARRTLNFDYDGPPEISLPPGQIQPEVGTAASTPAASTSDAIGLETPTTFPDDLIRNEEIDIMTGADTRPTEEPATTADKLERESSSNHEDEHDQEVTETGSREASSAPASQLAKLPDPELLSNRLSQLEEQLSSAKGRGVDFSDKLRKAQDAISLLLENGTNSQSLLSQLEQESNNLMEEMEQFQHQGEIFFDHFESIRHDIRILQQGSDQISTLRGVLAHTRSQLASEKEKTMRAERELAELREQMQINELTSQFDYLESGARQLESRANIMQMLLQQTRRQLDAVRITAADALQVEAEIERAIHEQDRVARTYANTIQDLGRIRARLLSTAATMVDSATQYEL